MLTLVSVSSFILSVEFLLGEASSYAPTDTVSLENAMFLYQVSAGNERIVAHGFNRIGNALFAAYASSVGEGGEVVIEGSSSQTVTSGNSSIFHRITNMLLNDY